MTVKYCTHCGSKLKQVGDFASLWFLIYECPNGEHCPDYIEVGDSRWIFPLLELQANVKKCLLSANSDLVQLAATRIKQIDYKTVSIIGFEHTLLGCYRDENNSKPPVSAA